MNKHGCSRRFLKHQGRKSPKTLLFTMFLNECVQNTVFCDVLSTRLLNAPQIPRFSSFFTSRSQSKPTKNSTTPVHQSTTPVLLCTTKYDSSTTPYYKVLLQCYSVLKSTTPVLLRTTKYYALQSTTPVLLCTTRYHSSSTPYCKVPLHYYSVLLQYYFVPRTTQYYEVLIRTASA